MSRTIPREVVGADWRVWPEQIYQSGWAKLFDLPAGAPLRLHVDIGSGQGEFLTELARRNPGDAFVGVEISFKRVLKLARRLARSEVRNIRLVGVDAGWVVREAFEDDSVSVFWINFPDPWPRRRHQPRRLIEPRFVRDLARKLTAGGSLRVATDHSGYAEAVESVLVGERLLENVSAPAAYRCERPDTIRTAYQRAWNAHGRSCRFFHYRRVEPRVVRRPG
jgi:tRNA (guanine-N7-)-methyltransferase